MKKSRAVSISFLSSIALSSITAFTSGCDRSVGVHLNASGQCINEETGFPVDQRICYGYRGGYYGGTHYVYVPGASAPYYSNSSSPGYVHPWGASASSSTVRGVFGGSAAGGDGGGE